MIEMVCGHRPGCEARRRRKCSVFSSPSQQSSRADGPHPTDAETALICGVEALGRCDNRPSHSSWHLIAVAGAIATILMGLRPRSLWEVGMKGQSGFWDFEYSLEALSAAGEPLEQIARTVCFEQFRPALSKAVRRSDPSQGGGPGFDVVLKFKMLVLQGLYGLLLQQTAFQVRERLTWLRCCGLRPGDAVPDANTLWDFREALIKALPGTVCFKGVIRRYPRRALWPWAVKSLTPPWWALPNSATALVRRKRSRPGTSPRPGQTSRPNCGRKIETPAGRCSCPRPRRMGRRRSTLRSRPSAPRTLLPSIVSTGSSAAVS